MDYYKLIQELREEKELLDEAIRTLESIVAVESLDSTPDKPKRRGRKSMDPKERSEVSHRMKNYWRKQRKTKPAN